MPQQRLEETWLTTGQAAAWLHVNRLTIQRLVNSRKLLKPSLIQAVDFLFNAARHLVSRSSWRGSTLTEGPNDARC
jgi:hypothetical protein